MFMNEYEELLTGGHPNSLGNTVAVVEDVLKDQAKLQQLYDCYGSSDQVVRLRVSNAIKRVCRERPEWVADHLDGLLTDIAAIDQASTKWTLSTLFMWLDRFMSESQRAQAIDLMKNNLHFDDWIVQNTTAESLAHFAQASDELKTWLRPELERLTNSPLKSVSGRARKLLERL